MTGWTVEVGGEVDLPSGLGARLEAVVLHALTAEEAPPIELSVALVTDETIAALHRDYLSTEGVTDVISFPLNEPGQRLVGDVYIGFAQAQRQAAEAMLEVEEELLRLTIHGTLHVLGWDHPDEGTERADSPMYQRQEELLASFLSADRN